MKYRITDRPAYTHDCDCCTYLGTLVNGPDTERVDCYLCGNAQTGSLIARTGSDGADYDSMPMDLLTPAIVAQMEGSIIYRALGLLRATI